MSGAKPSHSATMPSTAAPRPAFSPRFHILPCAVGPAGCGSDHNNNQLLCLSGTLVFPSFPLSPHLHTALGLLHVPGHIWEVVWSLFLLDPAGQSLVFLFSKAACELMPVINGDCNTNTVNKVSVVCNIFQIYLLVSCKKFTLQPLELKKPEDIHYTIPYHTTPHHTILYYTLLHPQQLINVS